MSEVIVLTAVWCHACLFMKKTFKQVVASHPDIKFKFIDIDLDDEASNYDVGKILPVLIFMRDNEPVHRCVGEKTLIELESEIHNAF